MEQEEFTGRTQELSQHGVSQDTINMIARKQQIGESAKKLNEERLEKNEFIRDVQQHQRLAESIRAIF